MSMAADSSLAVSYAGYRIVARLDQMQAEGGSLHQVCRLTASELNERPEALVFTRTLVLGTAQAALMNTAQPGMVPPLDRMQAELVAHGMRYMETLVDLVNRGFRAIAPGGNRSVSDARSFLGMTDAALQTREG
jgi:hypothetical protein